MSASDVASSEPIQLLDDNGQLLDGVEDPAIDDETLVGIYEDMRLARHLDERAVSLQRQGRMGTYPPLAGQEASQVASAHALAADDWVFPSYREHAALFVRGVPLKNVLLYWMGSEKGNVVPEGSNVFTVSVPIATQVPHATGTAWAAKLTGGDEVTLCYFGDGATSEGDFHEGMNFAGVFDVPAVFFCNNNQWAISVPRERQTASATLAQKAHAYGIEGVQVDGMDPLAVYEVTRRAVEKARGGQNMRPVEAVRPDGGDRSRSSGSVGWATRPTMIEAVQYRFGAHTTADDPTAYRDEAEVERWREKDPIPRMERYLRDRGLLDDEQIAAVEAEIKAEVAEAIRAAEREPRPEPAEIFAHVYADAPRRLDEQLDHLQRLRARHGDDAFFD